MIGSAKVFVKDLYELGSRPFLGAWLVLVPLVLLYVAGNIDVHPSYIRTIVQPAESAKPAGARVRALASEFTQLAVVERDWDVSETSLVMAQDGAQIALAWDGRWQIFLRPSSSNEREQLLVLAYQLAMSIGFEKPWQIKFLESIIQSDQTSESDGQRPGRDGAANLATAADAGIEIVDLGSPTVEQTASLIPRIIALIVALLPFLVACSSLIRERENGTLATLIVAPRVGWWNIVAGKAITSLFVAIVNLFVLLLASVFLFAVPARIGLWPVFGVQLLAMLMSTLLGLAASILVKSQTRIYFLSVLYAFCLIFLTGLFFPLERTAAAVQYASHLFPLTFSQEPLTQWMAHGLLVWPFEAHVTWLAGQCVVALILVAGSVHIAKIRI